MLLRIRANGASRPVGSDRPVRNPLGRIELATANVETAPASDDRSQRKIGSIVSIRVGFVAPLGPDRAPSGFVKYSTPGRIAIRRIGLADDKQADLRVHGGRDKAVYLYPAEHYAAWRQEPPENSTILVPGGFGENLTTLGLREENVCIRDILLTGSALLQVTQPRQPCFKLALRFDDKRMPGAMLRTGRSGWYAPVLEEGILESPIPIGLVEWPNRAWPVSRLVRLITHRAGTLDDMVELSDLPGLAEHWRQTAATAVEQAAFNHLRLVQAPGSTTVPSLL